MPYKYKWEWHFKSEPVMVRQTVLEILHFLDDHLPGQTPDERLELRLIFSELLFNAVIHGNDSDTGKQVYVCVQVCDRLVSASIKDEGGGYNYHRVVDRAHTTADDFQKESGRGMRLVLALADDVEFSQNGSRVTFSKKIGPYHV